MLTCFLTSIILPGCRGTEKPDTSATIDTSEIIETSVNNPNPESVDKADVDQKNTKKSNPLSIETDILFIRDKYKIITEASNYKTVPFDTQCDEITSIKLERKYNEKGKLSYLQYKDCGEHGCTSRQHYYWDGKLIFIFHQNDLAIGSGQTIEEYRTYFKDGKMIRCLEKKVSWRQGERPIEDLLKKASNKEVDCTPDKLTSNLPEMESLSVDKAKKYFCPS